LTPERATVWIDGAPVTILPRRAPVGNSGPIRGRTLAIFPAPPDAAPALSAALPSDASNRFTATLEPGSRPALAVADLAEADVRTAGRALGLDEILFWDGRRAHVLACT
jgi:hypothetical protein